MHAFLSDTTTSRKGRPSDDRKEQPSFVSFFQKPRVSAAAFEALEVRQLMSAGQLDPTFGTGGKINAADLPFAPVAVATTANAKTIAVGSMNGNFAVARLNSDGTLDRTFAASNNGIAIADFGADRGESANAVAIQPDGKIVVAGSAGEGTALDPNDFDDDFAVVRINTNGSLDGSFDGTGAANNKIAFIDIKSAPIGATPGLVTGAANLPVDRYSTATAGQWTGNNDGLFSDKQLDDTSIWPLPLHLKPLPV